MMPSRSTNGTESGGSDHEMGSGATGVSDSCAPDSLPMERIRWAQRNPVPEVVSRPPPGSPPRLDIAGLSTEPGPAGDGLRARGVLRGFRNLLENLKRMTVGLEDERELVSVLVESVREVHEAGRRHGHGDPAL